VGLLDRFEQRLDRLVNGAFAKAFKAEVQPVELAAALQREMDDRAAVVSRDRTVAPNSFDVELAAHDFDRLSVYGEAIAAELAGMVSEYAGEQRYALPGAVRVNLGRDESLDTGIFRVRSEATPDVVERPADQPLIPTPEVGQPRLVVVGTAHALTRAVTRIGRGSEADLRIEDAGISRQHAEVLLGREVVLRDAGSTNGTYVNGIQIGEATLRDGDVIRLGGTSITFRAGR
jgi:hypothetical protein